MSIFHQQTLVLSTIYPEHIWIDIDLSCLKKSLDSTHRTVRDRVGLDRLYRDKVSQYLSESLGLAIESIFPSEDLQFTFVSKLINGFALSISGVKVVFIPSQDLDLMSFEIQQEWVDLSNWAADYYVPIRVDPEHNCLHLWGFISHQCLWQRANLDRVMLSYEVDGSDLISNLDSLWMACELIASGTIGSERGNICNLNPLSDSEVLRLIDRLKQHRSSFSPRLVLPFEQWGAIINDPKYLNIYANPAPVITSITNWFRSQISQLESVSDTLIERGWVTITDIGKDIEPLPGYMSGSTQPSKLAIHEIDRVISRTVNNFYTNQNPSKKLDLPTDIESPLLQLVYLMQHTTDETLRWRAAEYLWTNEPNRSKNWHRRIKDLGLVMQGHKLGLMVAAIPLVDGTYAILNRVYPIGCEDYLPPNVQLTLISENGDRLYQVDSRSPIVDSYIQLYFTASVGDRFNICITMNDASVTEAFVI
jgi:hypothetical protein